MPELKDWTSIGQAAPRPSGGIVAPPRPFAAEGFTQGVGALQRAVVDEEDRRENFRLMTAETKLRIKREEILAGLEEEQDFETIRQKYDEQMAPAYEEANKLMRSPRGREALGMRWGAINAEGKFDAQRLARAKEKSWGRGQLEEGLNGLADRGMVSANPVEFVEQGNDLIDAARDAGYLTAEEAAVRKRQQSVNMAKGALNALPPEARLRALDTKGSVADFLPPDDAAIMKEQAQNEIEANENRRLVLEARQREENFRDAYNLIQEGGTPTPELLKTLEPSQQEALRQYNLVKSQGFAEISDGKTLGEISLARHDMTTAGKKRWANYDLESKRHLLDGDTYNELVEARDTARGKLIGETVGDEKYISSAQSDGASAYINSTLATMGISGKDEDKAKVGVFIQMVDDRIRQAKGDLNHIPEEDFKRIVSETAADVVLNNYYGRATYETGDTFTMKDVLGKLSGGGVEDLANETDRWYEEREVEWSSALRNALQSRGTPVTVGSMANLFMDVNRNLPTIIDALRQTGAEETEAAIVEAYLDSLGPQEIDIDSIKKLKRTDG